MLESSCRLPLFFDNLFRNLSSVTSSTGSSLVCQLLPAKFAVPVDRSRGRLELIFLYVARIVALLHHRFGNGSGAGTSTSTSKDGLIVWESCGYRRRGG